MTECEFLNIWFYYSVLTYENDVIWDFVKLTSH